MGGGRRWMPTRHLCQRGMRRQPVLPQRGRHRIGQTGNLLLNNLLRGKGVNIRIGCLQYRQHLCVQPVMLAAEQHRLFQSFGLYGTAFRTLPVGQRARRRDG